MVTIYALRFVFSDSKYYVGCTGANLGKRLREHRCLLKSGKHTCKPFQEAFSRYEGHGFFGIVLETCSKDDRRDAEIKWMRHYEDYGMLYNEHLISFRPSDEAIRKGVANAHNEPGNRWTPEANKKRSLAQLGKPKGHGAKISATKRARAMR